MDNDLEELTRLEQQLRDLDDKGSYGSPSPISKDTVFKFFREILQSEDSTKVANLDSKELGNLRLSVRAYKELALYAEAEGWDKIADYFDDKAEIVARTSMSKKGFWSQLFVTQIKKEQKMKEPVEKKKGFLFGKKEEQNDQT